MKKTLILIFMAILIVSGLSILFIRDKDFSENENRYLFKLEDIKLESFDEDMEKYLADQFVLRDKFMEVSTFFKRGLGYNKINDVYFGKDNSLYDIYSYSNRYLNSNINLINDFITTNNLRGYMVLVPSSAYISRERLGKFVYIKDEDKIIDDIYNRVNLEGIGLIDVLDKESYFKMDHHLNEVGAFKVFKHLMENLNKKYSSSYDYKLVSSDFKGTTYSKAGAFWYKGENLYKIEPKVKDYEILYNKEKGNLYDTDALKTKDKYTYYMSGNHGLVEIKGQGSGSILLIKDSYANIMVPYLMESYARITLVDLRFYNDSVLDLIDENTDLVFLYGLNSFMESTTFTRLK